MDSASCATEGQCDRLSSEHTWPPDTAHQTSLRVAASQVAVAAMRRGERCLLLLVIIASAAARDSLVSNNTGFAKNRLKWVLEGSVMSRICSDSTGWYFRPLMK